MAYHIRSHLDKYLSACQLGITLSSLVLGIYGEQQIAPLIEPWIARLPLGVDAASGSHAAASGIAATLVLSYVGGQPYYWAHAARDGDA